MARFGRSYIMRPKFQRTPVLLFIILKDLILQWNITAYLFKDLALQYNILAYLFKDLALQYKILTGIYKDLLIIYKIAPEKSARTLFTSKVLNGTLFVGKDVGQSLWGSPSASNPSEHYD